MDLLTDAERAEITGAIKDVTDTFNKTTCIISVKIDNASRMNTDTGVVFVDYSILGFVEFGHLQSDQTFMNEDGSVIKADVKCLLNMADMNAINLLDGNYQPIINMATDKMSIHGVNYRIINVSPDGALTDHNLICMIYADREPTLT